MISLKRLNKLYPAGGIHAVRDVEMELPDSGMVAIFGRSGCGKTTLLNCVGGLDRASSGSVLHNGTPISPDQIALRNRQVGYIFQNYNLSQSLTVFENVALSLRLCGMQDEREIERRVMAALESVHMEKYRKRLPNALSGGQQQRVAIARAIVKDPGVILADEPTGNLDEHNTVLVMDLLRDISKKHLVLLVTHEAELVDLYCDRVIEMSDGRVIDVRDNEKTQGFSGKSAGDIYLGDLPSSREELGEVVLEYYGAPEEKPTHLRLVSVGGTLYIKANTALSVKLLDSGVEAKLHEGKYTERAAREVRELSPVLSEALPEGKTGRMYSFKSALKSGFHANFKGARRAKKLLVGSLVCYPLIIVLILSIFGTVFHDLQNIEAAYDAKTVYVRADVLSNEQAQAYLQSGVADHVRVERYSYGGYPEVMHNYFFCIGNFETLSDEYSAYFSAGALTLPARALREGRVLYGKGVPERENEIVITRAFADVLLEKTGVNDLKDYEDLLYTVGKCGTWVDSVPGQTVVGVIDESEVAVYMHDYSYTQSMLQEQLYCEYGFFSDLSHTTLQLAPLSRGEIYCTNAALSDQSVRAGDSIQFCGLQWTVKGIIDVSEYIDTALFLEWVRMEYGENIFADKSAFSLWYYGADFYDYEEWLRYYGSSPKVSYEEDLAYLEEAYRDVYAENLSSYTKSLGEGMSSVLMHPEDLMLLTASVSRDLNREVFAGIYSYHSESFYAFRSTSVQDLISVLHHDLGEGNVVVPQEMRAYLANSHLTEFVAAGVAIGAVILVMALCLYFIMRSSLMGEIKEIGICRAIGVSRKNLVFRYFTEALVLFVFTIFIGYLLSSAAVFWLSGLNAVMNEFLYYPWWMALCALLGLFGISVLCGIAPILSLLRRTPAEILAKYDI